MNFKKQNLKTFLMAEGTDLITVLRRNDLELKSEYR